MTDQTAKLDAMLEQRESFLKLAVGKAMQEMNKVPSVENIRNYEAACKALDSYQARQPGQLERFETQAAALAYLQRTWQIERSKLSNDVRSGKVPKKDGAFTAADLDFYAQAVHLRPRTIEAANNDNVKNDLDVEKLREQRLKNDIREGLYVLRAKYEQDLAARAAYLKTDLSNYGPRVVKALLEKVSDLLREAGATLPENVNLQTFTPDLEQDYDEQLDNYLHQYAVRKIIAVEMA